MPAPEDSTIFSTVAPLLTFSTVPKGRVSPVEVRPELITDVTG